MKEEEYNKIKEEAERLKNNILKSAEFEKIKTLFRKAKDKGEELVGDVIDAINLNMTEYSTPDKSTASVLDKLTYKFNYNYEQYVDRKEEYKENHKKAITILNKFFTETKNYFKDPIFNKRETGNTLVVSNSANYKIVVEMLNLEPIKTLREVCSYVDIKLTVHTKNKAESFFIKLYTDDDGGFYKYRNTSTSGVHIDEVMGEYESVENLFEETEILDLILHD